MRRGRGGGREGDHGPSTKVTWRPPRRCCAIRASPSRRWPGAWAWGRPRSTATFRAEGARLRKAPHEPCPPREVRAGEEPATVLSAALGPDLVWRMAVDPGT